MRTRHTLPLLAAAALALASCGTARPPAESSVRASERDPRVLTLEDIQEAQQQNIGNVLDMIRRYRSVWLRTVMVQGRAMEPSAYQDRQRIGTTAAALRNVPLAAVNRIRYLTPSEAQGELGLDNLAGSIVVYTR